MRLPQPESIEINNTNIGNNKGVSDDLVNTDDDSLDGAHYLHSFEDGETTIIGDGTVFTLPTSNKPITSPLPDTTPTNTDLDDVNDRTIIDDTHLLGHINSSLQQHDFSEEKEINDTSSNGAGNGNDDGFANKEELSL